MRLLAPTVYRAFPELDSFSDDDCRIFVRNATVVLWRRIMRACVNAATILTLVIAEVWFLEPDPSPNWMATANAILLAVVLLITIGIGSLVIRDILLRLAIRRILNCVARCPQCRYSMVGLPVTADHRVTCPECACVTYVGVHAKHCVRGSDGSLRFLPGPSVQLPVEFWWTRKRLRTAARGTAAVLGSIAIVLGILLAIWEVRVRLMASAVHAAVAALPPGSELLAAVVPPAALVEGDNAVDALTEFQSRFGAIRDTPTERALLNWWPPRDFRLRMDPAPPRDGSPPADRTVSVQMVVREARAAGLLDSLDRIGLAPAIQFPTDPLAAPLFGECASARTRLFAVAMSHAANLASIWMLDACARGEPAEAARAFRALASLAAMQGIARPTPLGGSIVGAGQVMECLAEVARLPGGDEALRIARQAVDRNLRCRVTPESLSAIFVRWFQEDLLRVFGDPAVLRWRLTPWIRTEAYERAISVYLSNMSTRTEPSGLGCDFDREWAASIDTLPTLLLTCANSTRWSNATPSISPAPALPPMADAFMEMMSGRSLDFQPILLSDLALSCVLGIEEFRRTQGRLPASLEELVPGYLPTPPPTSLGVIYRTVQDPACPLGYQLYSKGFNGLDDGCSAFIDIPIVGAPVPPPAESLPSTPTPGPQSRLRMGDDLFERLGLSPDDPTQLADCLGSTNFDSPNRSVLALPPAGAHGALARALGVRADILLVDGGHRVRPGDPCFRTGDHDGIPPPPDAPELHGPALVRVDARHARTVLLAGLPRALGCNPPDAPRAQR